MCNIRYIFLFFLPNELIIGPSFEILIHHSNNYFITEVPLFFDLLTDIEGSTFDQYYILFLQTRCCGLHFLFFDPIFVIGLNFEILNL